MNDRRAVAGAGRGVDRPGRNLRDHAEDSAGPDLGVEGAAEFAHALAEVAETGAAGAAGAGRGTAEPRGGDGSPVVGDFQTDGSAPARQRDAAMRRLAVAQHVGDRFPQDGREGEGGVLPSGRASMRRVTPMFMARRSEAAVGTSAARDTPW